MPVTEEAFRSGYGQLVAKVWADEKQFDQLKMHPAQVLASFGIEIPHTAQVRVVQVVPTGKGNFDELWQDWREGERSGKFDLWIPTKPTSVGGGAVMDTNTTCTPCCTCT